MRVALSHGDTRVGVVPVGTWLSGAFWGVLGMVLSCATPAQGAPSLAGLLPPPQGSPSRLSPRQKSPKAPQPPSPARVSLGWGTRPTTPGTRTAGGCGRDRPVPSSSPVSPALTAAPTTAGRAGHGAVSPRPRSASVSSVSVPSATGTCHRRAPGTVGHPAQHRSCPICVVLLQSQGLLPRLPPHLPPHFPSLFPPLLPLLLSPLLPPLLPILLPPLLPLLLPPHLPTLLPPVLPLLFPPFLPPLLLPPYLPPLLPPLPAQLLSLCTWGSGSQGLFSCRHASKI